MHKEIEVAFLRLDRASGFIASIEAVYSLSHLPLGTLDSSGVPSHDELNRWWGERAIPASRQGLKEALEELGLPSERSLLFRSYGFSLSDQYWIKPEGCSLTWERGNFFLNPFSNDVGDALFGQSKAGEAFDFSSPDSASDGFLKKRWKIASGKRMLLKGGSLPFRQQPFNEAVASRFCLKLGIPCVGYSLVFEDGLPYSLCPDFIDENTELVPAWRLLMAKPRGNGESIYQRFLSCCRHLGIEGAQGFLDKMIVVDYLLANEDRHFNNFGAIRDAYSLEWVSFAPLYDSGSSLGFNKLEKEIAKGNLVECKPFKKKHEEQLG